MKRLQALLEQQPEMYSEIYQLKLLLKILSHPRWAGKVLEDTDTLGFFLDMIGDELKSEGFLTQEEMDEMPIGSLRHSDLDRGQIQKLSEAAALFSKQMAAIPELYQVKSPLEENVRTFGSFFGLNPKECAFLCMLLFMKSTDVIDSAIARITFYNFDHVCLFFAALMDESPNAVKQIIDAQSNLRQLGILTIDRKVQSRHGFLSMFKMIDALGEALGNEVFDEDTILRTLVSLTKPGTLDDRDYEHARNHIDNLDHLVRMDGGKHSILIYGDPGTGKTELAGLIAQRHGMEAFAVCSMDEDNGSIEPQDRLNAFNLAQNLLSIRKGRTLLIFDEVEDVFQRDIDKKKESKAWFNQLLENIKVPTIWLSNCAHIDPAYLRRFSYVMELKHPDQVTKKKLLAKYHPTMKLRKAFIDELTAFPDLSIATIRQAYTYAELSGLKRRAAETFIAHSVAGKHDANHWEKITFKTLQKDKSADQKLTNYPFNPAYININENLDAMVSGLKRTGEGRMVFFGPPGTGKTSLAHYLAKSIGKELIQQDAASLQSCWLGETEKLIHQAFEQAKKQKAILFLDEADSFLTSRATHARSWETSQVNQLLQEMEKFNGILIMSTNLIDRLDEAAARRFDYKIRFDYMNHAQRVTFFENWLQTQGTLDNYDSALYQTRLQSLDRIVPGYFQLLSRKVRISGETYDASQLFERLRMEMHLAHKDLSRPIGFVQ